MPALRWIACDEPSCRGARLAPYGRCLAHLEPAEVERYLAHAVEHGEIDARGVVLNDELTLRIVGATPDSDHQFWNQALFDEATFERGVWFYGAQFGIASFYKAVFEGEAMFDHAVFRSDATFTGARFNADRDWATFTDVSFRGQALFNGAWFKGQAHFANSEFHGAANFYGAQCAETFAFEHTTLHSDGIFTEAVFGSIANFEHASVHGTAHFERATFTRQLLLDGLQLDPGPLALTDVRFVAGVKVAIGAMEIDLSRSDFAGPSLVRGDGTHTRIESVEDADIGNLVLAAVDVRACRFCGAHNLDRLRMEDVTPFEGPPPGWGGWRFSWPPLWRWTPRQVIAEEHQWRLENDDRWAARSAQPTSTIRPRDSDTIAKIYRSLRKGREDNRDGPGASDFYYGEMEMRRKRGKNEEGNGSAVERIVLTMYWLLSGYALRASRAIASLVVVLAVFAVLFKQFGIQPHPSWRLSVTYTIQSATNLLGADVTRVQSLSAWGDFLQVIIKLLGPLLLGLALVSLRGRVSR